MSAFTDEDLKQAKGTWTDGDYDYMVDGQLLKNLLARLEACERLNKASKDLDDFDCIHVVEDQCRCGSMQLELLREFEEADDAWRKVVGKD